VVLDEALDDKKATEEMKDANAAELKSAYVIRPIEKYQQQIEEDAEVEKYWSVLFESLRQD